MKLVAIALIAVVAGTAAADEREPGFELRLEPGEVSSEPGGQGEVSLTIVPQPGYSIDRDGPLRINASIEPAEGVSLVRRRYRRADAADARAESPRFDLRYRAVTAGTYELRVDVRFWICRRYTCRAAHEQRTVPIRVVEPPPPTPPSDAGSAQ